MVRISKTSSAGARFAPDELDARIMAAYATLVEECGKPPGVSPLAVVLGKRGSTVRDRIAAMRAAGCWPPGSPAPPLPERIATAYAELAARDGFVPSIRAIGRELGIDPTTVRRQVRRLTTAGNWPPGSAAARKSTLTDRVLAAFAAMIAETGAVPHDIDVGLRLGVSSASVGGIRRKLVMAGRWPHGKAAPKYGRGEAVVRQEAPGRPAEAPVTASRSRTTRGTPRPPEGTGDTLKAIVAGYVRENREICRRRGWDHGGRSAA